MHDSITNLMLSAPTIFEIEIHVNNLSGILKEVDLYLRHLIGWDVHINRWDDEDLGELLWKYGSRDLHASTPAMCVLIVYNLFLFLHIG